MHPKQGCEHDLDYANEAFFDNIQAGDIGHISWTWVPKKGLFCLNLVQMCVIPATQQVSGLLILSMMFFIFDILINMYTIKAHTQALHWANLVFRLPEHPLISKSLIISRKLRIELDWRVAYTLSVSFHSMQTFFLLLSASQDRSCNGNAHLDLFHYPFIQLFLLPGSIYRVWSGL